MSLFVERPDSGVAPVCRNYLSSLNCNINLKMNNEYYHQIQGPMPAVGVYWCDYVMWTESNMNIHRIPRDQVWSMRYVHELESFFKYQITSKDDFDEGFSDAATGDMRRNPSNHTNIRCEISPASSPQSVPPRNIFPRWWHSLFMFTRRDGSTTSYRYRDLGICVGRQ